MIYLAKNAKRCSKECRSNVYLYFNDVNCAVCLGCYARYPILSTKNLQEKIIAIAEYKDDFYMFLYNLCKY